MKVPDLRQPLSDILEAIELIHTYVHGADYEQFGAERMRQDAVLRQLGIIGEAAGRLPIQFRAAHQQIPWAAITGMRHRIVHDYGGVNLRIVWSTVEFDLPEIEAGVAALLKSIETLDN
jgi:uncharacterized protein with HEPN domain